MRTTLVLAVVVATSAATAIAHAVPIPAPHILYVNDCKPAGCPVTPGADDSRVNHSSQTSMPRVLSPFSGDQPTWNAFLACLRANYAPFNLDIVTTDPGASTPHYEIMVAGLSQELGLPADIGGISPFSCTVKPNQLAFTFANYAPTDALRICWTASQESAHMFGLEHSRLATDAMTYIEAPPQKTFVNASACIGITDCCQPAVECQCGRTMINSHTRLLDVLGPPKSPPVVTFTMPTDGATVSAGFRIAVTVADADGLDKVELFIDDALVSRFFAPPYELTAAPSLALGTHTIVARTTDIYGTPGEATVMITRGEPLDVDGVAADAGTDLDPAPAGGCCQSSGGGGLSSVLALLLVAFVLTARRRR